jgi:DNA adenine methylase
MAKNNVGGTKQRWTRPSRPALPYYGSKWRLSPWVAGYFGPHRAYVEACGGSAAVLLRKEPSPIEIYNDVDGQVLNYFRVLRDPVARDELVALLEATPYARAEYAECHRTSDDPDASPVERARRLFVRGWQGWGAGGASTNRNVSWGAPSLRSPAGSAPGFVGAVANLEAVGERLRRVHIEQMDARALVRRYDTPETLHYVDPPYVDSTLSASKPYRSGFTEADHRSLVATLNELTGQVVLSGFRCPLYDEILEGWERHERQALTGARGATRTWTTECVWLNPRAAEWRRRRG